MCTATFVPSSKHGFIFTHNRDEKLSRKTSTLPQKRTFMGKSLFYPVDTDKNGTWFCCDEQGRLACILNGAFEKHSPNPPYKKSRGLIVLESFVPKTFDSWIKKVDLNNIEPFTLILFENSNLTELRWDGKNKHLKNLSTAQTHIWSSVTLYSKDVISKRETWLKDWLNSSNTTPKSLFDFHNSAGESQPETNLKMEVEGSHKTVSITQLYVNKLERWMNHVNLVSQETTNFRIE